MNVLAQLYRNAAQQLMLPCKYDLRFDGIEICFHKTRYFFRGGATPFNDAGSVDIACNKYCVNAILHDAGFPVPSAGALSKANCIDGHWVLPEFNYPLVAKPTINPIGGGLDVLCNIQNKEALIQYLNKTADKYRFISIESFEAGLTTYRVTIFFNKVIAVARRDPASIIGDGNHSIAELIAIENIDRKKRKHTYPIDTIKLEQEHLQKLKELGLTPLDIPKKDEKIVLCYASSSMHGESIVALGDSICPENEKLLCDAAKTLNLNLVGFDVICEDINRPIQDSRGFIIEANFNPDVTIHELPSNGIAIPVTRILLHKLIRMHPFCYFMIRLRYIFSRYAFYVRSGVVLSMILLVILVTYNGSRAF